MLFRCFRVDSSVDGRDNDGARMEEIRLEDAISGDVGHSPKAPRVRQIYPAAAFLRTNPVGGTNLVRVEVRSQGLHRYTGPRYSPVSSQRALGLQRVLLH